MVYSLTIKQKAIKLREKGYSLNYIAESLEIAKSTASIWLSDVKLSPSQRSFLRSNANMSRQKTIMTKRSQQEVLNKHIATQTIQRVNLSNDLAKIYCTLLWWCEGNKNESFVRFTNSDPTLVKNFLIYFRKSFPLDEKKFRVLIHIHSYHDEQKQKKFWSKVTNIPIPQFYRSFQKPHTGKRIHKNYQGCIAVSYYDAKIAKELEAIYNAFTLISGGVR